MRAAGVDRQVVVRTGGAGRRAGHMVGVGVAVRKAVDRRAAAVGHSPAAGHTATAADSHAGAAGPAAAGPAAAVDSSSDLMLLRGNLLLFLFPHQTQADDKPYSHPLPAPSLHPHLCRNHGRWATASANMRESLGFPLSRSGVVGAGGCASASRARSGLGSGSGSGCLANESGNENGAFLDDFGNI